MTARRTYTRHGLTAPMVRLKLRGMGAIDRRTAAARSLLAWRAALVTDLGGEAQLSAQEQKLVDLAARASALLDHIDAWIFEQSSVVNRRSKALLPVVVQRQQLADHLARLLGQLGLQRRAKPVPTLADYLRERAESTPPDEGGRPPEAA